MEWIRNSAIKHPEPITSFWWTHFLPCVVTSRWVLSAKSVDQLW